MKNKNIILLFLAMVVLASWAAAQIPPTLTLQMTPAGPLNQMVTYTVTASYFCTAGNTFSGTLDYSVGAVSNGYSISCTCQLMYSCGAVSFDVTPPAGSNSLAIGMSGTLTSTFTGATTPVSASRSIPVTGGSETCDYDGRCEAGETSASCTDCLTACGDGVCSPGETCASGTNDCPQGACQTSRCTAGSCINTPALDNSQVSGLCDDYHGCSDAKAVGLEDNPGCMCLSGSCATKTVIASGCGDGVCSPGETCATGTNDCPKPGTCRDPKCTFGSCGGVFATDYTQESGLCDDYHGCSDAKAVGLEDNPGCMCLSGSCATKTVTTPYCGDGTCNGAETTATCADCYCGDGRCNPNDEDWDVCPADCPTIPWCGDGTCNGLETTATCADCYCGDGRCNAADEDWDVCPADCPAPPWCGDGTCNGLETTATCADCFCGDGRCNPTDEDWDVCPADCPAIPYCGDGSCNGIETSATCSVDCGMVGRCGDGVCNYIPFETPTSCPADCPVNNLQTCGDHVCTDDFETVASCETDCKTQPDPVISPRFECSDIVPWYDTLTGAFQGWKVNARGGTPPYTFVWQCDRNTDNDITIDDLLAPTNPDKDFWFEWRLPQEFVPADCRASDGLPHVFVKVSDNRSDTQILEKELIYPELSSIVSTLSTDCPDVRSVPQNLNTGTYYYGDPVTPLPYRSTDLKDLMHWRLFEKDTTWVKILGITPMLRDTRYDQNWTRTSPDFPGDPNGVTHIAYIVGGCERTSRDVLKGNGGLPYTHPSPEGIVNVGLPKAQYYWHPDTVNTGVSPTGGIDDSFTITIETDAGVKTTTVDTERLAGGSIPIRSLLPFPPADSLGWYNKPIWMPYPSLLHFHPFEGARYSSVRFPFKVPDSAKYLLMRVEYTCYDKYLRYWGDLGYDVVRVDPFNPFTWYLVWNEQWEPCTIEDTSKVWTSLVIPEPQLSKSDLSEAKIDVSGYYDVKINNLTGDREVTSGYIRLNMSPDEFAGALLHVNQPTATKRVPSSKYQHLSYPVRHRLLKKWKPMVSGPLVRLYYSEDDYGYKDTEFGYDGRCGLPACKGCVCAPNDLFNPTCTDTTNPANPVSYKPNIDTNMNNDCRCKAADSCVVDVCNAPLASKRTYHEFESSYFDFTEFYTKELKPKENYLSHYPDMVNQKSITIDRVESAGRSAVLSPTAVGPTCVTDFDETSGFNIRTDSCVLDILWPKYTVLYHTGGIDAHEAQASLNGQLIATIPEFYPVGDPGPYYERFATAPPWHRTKDVTAVAQMGTNIYRAYAYDYVTSDAAIQAMIEVKYENDVQYEIIQEFYFSAVNIKEQEFMDFANFTVYTHFREKNFSLGDMLVKRECTELRWEATNGKGYSIGSTGTAPAKRTGTGELQSGDTITVTVQLQRCGGGTISSTQDVKVNVPGYENGLEGVWNKEGQAFVTTSGGTGQFSFTLGNAPASVSLDYEGNYDKAIPEGNLPSTSSFVLGVTEVTSPFASVEFFLLVLIAFLLLFFWRWFRRGRMDYEGMLQELQGEPSE